MSSVTGKKNVLTVAILAMGFVLVSSAIGLPTAAFATSGHDYNNHDNCGDNYSRHHDKNSDNSCDCNNYDNHDYSKGDHRWYSSDNSCDCNNYDNHDYSSCDNCDCNNDHSGHYYSSYGDHKDNKGHDSSYGDHKDNKGHDSSYGDHKDSNDSKDKSY